MQRLVQINLALDIFKVESAVLGITYFVHLKNIHNIHNRITIGKNLNLV
jgi:hypothetical protein